MRHAFRLGLLAFVLAVLLPAADDRPIQVTILHVNDTHGVGLLPGPDGRSHLACAGTVINRLRGASTADQVFTVHIGDMVRVHGLGKPPVKDALAVKSRGAVEMAVLNELRFDLLSPGNHEFDHGEAHARELLGQARFPVLNANVIANDTRKPMFTPWVIRQAGPARIAFIGLMPGAPDKTSPTGPGFTIRSPLEVARELVPELRRQADAVVLLAHIEHGNKPEGVVTDERIAAAVPGIDVICGGHTHTRLDQGMTVRDPEGRDTLIVQAQWHWLFIGQVDLTLEKAGDRYRVAKASARLHAVDAARETPDPGVQRVIAAAQ